jgi:SET domain-containing protein
VLIYTKRAIKEGEELGYDYGKEFWNEYIKPKGCRCVKCKEKITAPE